MRVARRFPSRVRFGSRASRSALTKLGPASKLCVAAKSHHGTEQQALLVLGGACVGAPVGLGARRPPWGSHSLPATTVHFLTILLGVYFYHNAVTRVFLRSCSGACLLKYPSPQAVVEPGSGASPSPMYQGAGGDCWLFFLMAELLINYRAAVVFLRCRVESSHVSLSAPRL